MSEQTNEMHLPVISVQPIAAQQDVAMSVPTPAEDPSIAIGSPDNSRHSSCVSVYAESITPSGDYNPDSPICTFDVVFSVGIRGGETSKTYRVVKRIGIDRVKLACDAECSAPVSIVEEKSEARKAEAAATAKRFRILAGLE